MSKYKQSFALLNITLLMFKYRRISIKHIPRTLKYFAMEVVTAPFKIFETIKYRKILHTVNIEKPPIFILGHWRSGTTHLHNVLAKSEQFCFPTAMQVTFPNCFLMLDKVKDILVRSMPKRSDNIPTTPFNPQEEEYALAMLSPHSYYHLQLFPQAEQHLFEKYLLMNSIDNEELAQLKNIYLFFLKKVSYINGHKQLLLKNPVNTARIPFLLKLFPEAKFIYIHRNPYEIFVSSIKVFENAFRQVAVQNFTEQQIENFVLSNYVKIMKNYFQSRSLIPPENLIEIKFENFKEEPLEQLGEIYRKLNVPYFKETQHKFQSYLETIKDYEQNTYDYPQETIDKVNKHWGFAFETWNYSYR